MNKISAKYLVILSQGRRQNSKSGQEKDNANCHLTSFREHVAILPHQQFA